MPILCWRTVSAAVLIDFACNNCQDERHETLQLWLRVFEREFWCLFGNTSNINFDRCIRTCTPRTSPAVEAKINQNEFTIPSLKWLILGVITRKLVCPTFIFRRPNYWNSARRTFLWLGPSLQQSFKHRHQCFNFGCTVFERDLYEHLFIQATTAAYSRIRWAKLTSSPTPH